jgi:EmrB/QacA subfamily drug resistance transporter
MTSTHTPHQEGPPRPLLLALGLAVLLAALDQTIVATALPTIAGELGGLTQLAWVVTSYLLASTVSTPLYGKLGDVAGRKPVLLGAIVVFLAGSLLAGAATSMLELVLLRALQGLGAGGLIVTAMAVLADVTPPAQRARYMGLIGGVFAVASVAGPLLGGLFVDHLSWRWVFYANLPVGGAALFVIATRLERAPRRDRRPVDLLGAGLLSAAASCLVLVTSWGGTVHAWGSPTILALATAGLAAAVAFVAQERRAPDPVLPLSLFASRAFSVANATGFFVGVAMFGAVTFLPLYLQVVGGASATEAGLRLLPFVAGSLLASAISGRAISRGGRYKAFPVIGAALMTLGMLMLSRLGAGTAPAVAAADMLVVGVGIGLVMQVVILIAQSSAAQRDIGVATSTATLSRSIGASLGVALFGAMFASRLADGLGALPPAARALATGGVRLDPAQVRALPPGIRPAVLDAFASALGHTFLLGAALCGIALASALLLPGSMTLAGTGAPGGAPAKPGTPPGPTPARA